MASVRSINRILMLVYEKMFLPLAKRSLRQGIISGVCIQRGWADPPESDRGGGLRLTLRIRKAGDMHPTGMLSC